MHPNAEKDTLIGTIGQPYSPHPLLHTKTAPSENRFHGHKPGDNPMKYAQLPQPGRHKHIDDPNPDRHNLYRFAMWCECPHEAYLALTDAIYRPQVALTETHISSVSRRALVTFKVKLPFFIPEKSALCIDFEQKGGNTILANKVIERVYLNPAGTKDLNRAGGYETTRAVSPGEFMTFTAKVRLDLHGDTKVQLPYEPLFCDADIETQASESQEKDEQKGKDENPQTSHKWIVVKKGVSEAPKTHLDDIRYGEGAEGRTSQHRSYFEA
jgi:hypothetical protein